MCERHQKQADLNSTTKVNGTQLVCADVCASQNKQMIDSWKENLDSQITNSCEMSLEVHPQHHHCPLSHVQQLFTAIMCDTNNI